jgi:hypothetical protein
MNWLLLVLAILAEHVVTEVGIRRHGTYIEGNPLLGGRGFAFAVPVPCYCKLKFLPLRVSRPVGRD